MERGLMMVLHSAIIGLILFILMVFVFKQKEVVAENRSIVIAAFVLIYMVVFGHGLPTSVNKDL
jgi:ACR3 family arsenite efflux pump ArsB